MIRYMVTVFAVAESGEQTGLGTVTVEAVSLGEAKRLAMHGLWDERLNAASCHPRYENKPTGSFRSEHEVSACEQFIE